MQEDTFKSMSTGEILRRLINNLSAMVDRQVVLAKEEAKADAVQLGTGAGVLAAGALFLFATIAALIAAAALAIFPTMGPVGIALIVAAVYLVLGLILAFIGYRMVKVQPLSRTRQSIKEDVQWARTQVTSPGR